MVTAEAINARIEQSNAANGRHSPITNMGQTFIDAGRKYGVNPAVVVAIMQRESQLGADGSVLPTRYNNFAGLTAGSNGSYPGPCGAQYFLDRYWQVFCTPKQGIEGVFQFLRQPIYTATGGRLEDVMLKYSPPDENDWGAMWNTLQSVGLQLGTVIGPDTNIYAPAAASPQLGLNATGWKVDQLGNMVQTEETSLWDDFLSGLTDRAANWGGRVLMVVLGVLVLGIGLWRVIQSG